DATPSDPAKAKLLEDFKASGVTLLQRFFPSEFGNDVDHSHVVEAAKTILVEKVQFRRAVEASGIPYTFVACNWFAGYFLPTLAQAGATGLPVDKVTILGDGNVKAIFADEDDVAAFTIRSADDPRTLNKILYLRPSANTLTHNELVSLWEKKIGRTFQRVYIPEEQVLKQIQGVCKVWMITDLEAG
ncbi:hypothetical protein BHM03_00047339, partial [Ensete ventricosum]